MEIPGILRRPAMIAEGSAAGLPTTTAAVSFMQAGALHAVRPTCSGRAINRWAAPFYRPAKLVRGRAYRAACLYLRTERAVGFSLRIAHPRSARRVENVNVDFSSGSQQNGRCVYRVNTSSELYDVTPVGSCHSSVAVIR